MTVAIVDDDAADCLRSAEWTRRYWGGRGERDPLYIQTFSSGNEFLAALAHGRFSLVLLDCCMPGTDGLAAARALRALDGEAVVIFTTASCDYAVDGYSVEAAGYLVKPYSFEAFTLALDRARPRLVRQRPFLLVPAAGGEAQVLLEELVYCDADKHYSQLHLAGARPRRVRISFSALLRLLAPYPQFLFCYRGCAVNLAHVRRAEELAFLMDTGERVPFRRKERAKLLRQYEDYLFEKARREHP